MIPSDNKYWVDISFNQALDGLELTLIDGMFNVIFNGISQHLRLELAKGVYQLKGSFIDYYQEYLLLVDEAKVFKFDFNYPSVTPILSFKTTHEYFSANSEYYSSRSTF